MAPASKELGLNKFKEFVNLIKRIDDIVVKRSNTNPDYEVAIEELTDDFLGGDIFQRDDLYNDKLKIALLQMIRAMSNKRFSF